MSESDPRGAALIERLLADPSLRARFRTDPARVMREHGLDRLADQLDGPALRTLELRQSRSSLAGALFAAAAEGVALAEMGVHAAPALAHDAAHLAHELAHPHHAHPAPPRSAPANELAPVAIAPLQHPQAGQGTTVIGGAPGSPPTPDGAQSGTTVIDPVSTPPAAGGSGAQSGTTVIDPGAPGPVHHLHHAHPQAGTGTTIIDPAGAADAATHDPQRLLAYPGDDATPRQIALWMGAHAVKAGLPPELPVMAALTESGLRNVPYGDRDSLGFFQMRTSIWDSGSYAGYPDHPERQMQWFIDQALAVRQANPALAENPSSWGEWVADIEQPAAAYRGRYADHLAQAQALVGGFDFQAALTPPPSPGRLALSVAERFLGTPYDYGGSSPRTGFDCSGLVQYSFAQEGIHLPRVAAEQFEVGLPVARSDLQPGDAVFFADPNGYVHHVGLYIGNGEFINAPHTGADVRIDSLSEPYFAEQYAGARRYLPAAGIEPSFARSLPTIGR